MQNDRRNPFKNVYFLYAQFLCYIIEWMIYWWELINNRRIEHEAMCLISFIEGLFVE